MKDNAVYKFEYQKISPEDQTRRGILGRLVGKISSWKSPTRNGRRYNRDLWEKVFKDPIFQEKINNRCCFGELCHPIDGREEIDPEKVAICLAEMPQISDDGFVYGVFDILNSPCGKILKTMLDYGTNIGVSSRGSGDLFTDYDGQESVDPDTYDCVCWDAVFVPSVKDAHPAYVTESLNTKRTLRESLDALVESASDEDRKVMKEALRTIEEGLKGKTLEVIYTDADGKEKTTYFECDKNYKVDSDQLQTAILSSDNDIKEIINISESLNESEDEAEDITDSESESAPEGDVGFDDNEPDEELLDDEFDTESEKDDSDIEKEEDPERVVNAFDYPMHIKYAVEKNFHGAGDYKIDYHRRVKDVHCSTKKELADSIVNVFGDGIWDPRAVEMTKQKVDEDLTIKNCINNSKLINESLNVNSNTSSEVGNAESDVDIINELQETLEKNSALEAKIVSLQEKLSVCYAKEVKNEGLAEQLNKSAEEVAKKAAKIDSLQARVQALTEKLTVTKTQLEDRDATITKLQESSNSMQESRSKLNEAYNSTLAQKDSKIKDLSSKVRGLGNEVRNLNESITQINEAAENERTQLTEKLEKANSLVEKYKKVANKAVDRYIESKALMLGASSNEVKNRLPENYTFNDIDKACEDLQTYKLGITKLPFRASAQPLVESAKVEVRTPGRESILPADGFQGVDDVDDNLLALAGLI